MVSKVYKNPMTNTYATVKVGFSFTFLFFWWTGIPFFTRKQPGKAVLCIFIYLCTLTDQINAFLTGGSDLISSLIGLGVAIYLGVCGNANSHNYLLGSGWQEVATKY